MSARGRAGGKVRVPKAGTEGSPGRAVHEHPPQSPRDMHMPVSCMQVSTHPASLQVGSDLSLRLRACARMLGGHIFGVAF